MEKYELENRYYEDDEIDLVDLLKTIIREKNLVIITTVIFTVLVSGFAFYKTNRAQNYGVEIKFSNETAAKINKYNERYKNISPIFNEIIQDSFDSLLNKTEEDISVVSAEETQEIAEIMKKDNSFVKIVDGRNKSYKLFTKLKHKEIENQTDKFIETVNSDNEYINNEINKNLLEKIAVSDERLKVLTEETEVLNEKVMEVVRKYFSAASKENISLNISFVAPILYTEYQQKINALDFAYLTNIQLKELQKDIGNDIINLSGEKNIISITVSSPSSSSGISSKLIIVIGLFLGLCAGMFFAIIKAPLKNIFKELKEEKK